MLQEILDLHMLTASTGFVTLASLLTAASVAFLLLTGVIKTQIKWHYGVATFAVILGICHRALGIYHTFFA